MIFRENRSGLHILVQLHHLVLIIQFDHHGTEIKNKMKSN